VSIPGDKLGYLLGIASGRQHNIDRAAQNAAQMARIGIFDNAQGRAILREYLTRVAQQSNNVVSVSSNQYGNFLMRESLLAGPRGVVLFRTAWRVAQDGTQHFSTGIPMGFGGGGVQSRPTTCHLGSKVAHRSISNEGN
jgi:filamentous hemagglutinin